MRMDGDRRKIYESCLEDMNLPMGSIVFRQQRQMARSLGRALTISEPATIENFKEHLSGGEYILGVII